MRMGFKAWIFVAAAVVAGLLLFRVSSKAQAPAAAQAPAYRAPRTADGKPNLNGIWQALNEANWDLEPHAAAQGPVFALGAQFSIPGGTGVIEGGTIPYKPEALAKKKANFADPPERRSGDQMLHGRRAAFDLFALSVPDYSGQGHDHDGL